jgi:hypothetical protein
MSWHKTALNEINAWLGFSINAEGPSISVPTKKLDDILNIFLNVQKGETFTIKAITSMVGKLQWALTAAPFCRPLLQPFWSWMKATKIAGKPSQLLKMIARLFSQALLRPTISGSPYREVRQLHAASDASAESETGKASIGGWFSWTSPPSKQSCWWLMEALDETRHGWAFMEGDPRKRIFSIEMFGSLILVKAIMATTIAAYRFQSSQITKQMRWPC